MAKELSERGKQVELLRLLQRSEMAYLGKPTELTPLLQRRIVNEGAEAKRHLIESNLRLSFRLPRSTTRVASPSPT